MGCDPIRRSKIPRHSYFNPRTPCGVRPSTSEGYTTDAIFQSTHPVWGATCKIREGESSVKDFNPRTPCGVRRPARRRLLADCRISIHAPRVGCDVSMGSGGYIYQISIHAPRVGCDEHCMSTPKTSWTFQSTHPVWGATGFLMVTVRVAKFQSTHPVWGATEWLGQKFLDDAISIHAPRVGCDISGKIS